MEYQNQPNSPFEYDPSNDTTYMSEQMVEYFRNKLLGVRQKILDDEKRTSLSLLNDPNRQPDHVDQGSEETLRLNKFAFQEQEDYVRKEVEHALEKIEDGTYGFCEETQEIISVERLKAVPYARYTIEVQRGKEALEKRFNP